MPMLLSGTATVRPCYMGMMFLVCATTTIASRGANRFKAAGRTLFKSTTAHSPSLSHFFHSLSSLRLGFLVQNSWDYKGRFEQGKYQPWQLGRQQQLLKQQQQWQLHHPWMNACVIYHKSHKNDGKLRQRINS